MPLEVAGRSIGVTADSLRPLKQLLQPQLGLSAPMVTYLLFTLSASLAILGLTPSLRTPLVFIWNCFFKPFTKSRSIAGEQKDSLDAFYSGQAHVYDTTRRHLLEGRETMLQLLASHLRAQPQMAAGSAGERKPKIWVDIGGGTGWNIEKMSVPSFRVCIQDDQS